MNIEDVREYCLSLPNTTEDMPFGDDILCLRVDGRIFALLWLGWPDTHIALKCNPDIATALREQYRAVRPAYHMNKRCWNDLYTDSDMGDETLKHCINHSTTKWCAKCRSTNNPRSYWAKNVNLTKTTLKGCDFNIPYRHARKPR